MTAPQFAAHIEAGHVGQADVEHHKINATGRAACQRVVSQFAALDGKSLLRQGVGQRLGNGRFIVDNQNVHDGDDNSFAPNRRSQMHHRRKASASGIKASAEALPIMTMAATCSGTQR